MNRKRLRILNVSFGRRSGVITGEDFEKYTFDLTPESVKLKNQLIRGAEVEFTVVREGNPSEVTAVAVCRAERTSAHDDKRYGKAPSSSNVEEGFANDDRRNGNRDIMTKGKTPNIVNTKDRQESGSHLPSIRYIPQDTRDLLAGKEDHFENYYLKLNKFSPFDDQEAGRQAFRFVKYKSDRREKVVFEYFKPDFSPCELPKIVARQQKSIQDLGFETESFSAKPEWRVVSGLGGASVYETSITLHHLYGFPYLPGSAVKGVTRSWLVSESLGGDEKEAGQDEGFLRLFGGKKGDKSQRGSVIFFDAFPQENPEIEVDIMTPHNSEYYGSRNKAPADYYEPIPIPFLTVGKKTAFRFTLAVQPGDNVEITSGAFAGKKVLDVARMGLEKALKEQGIGAKTAVGYGFMA